VDLQSLLRSRYGSEVQQALVLTWETLNQICSKRLIPFLSDFVASLEQCGHLHLSEENRRILLSMSAATADRLLQFPRRKATWGANGEKWCAPGRWCFRRIRISFSARLVALATGITVGSCDEQLGS
jgi:hypothetical protein